MATQNTAMDNAALIKEVNEAHKHKKYSVGYHAQTVVAVIVTLIMLFPLYWMIATSFKSAEEVQLVIPTLFPHEFHPENYLNVLQKANFMKYYWNTIVMTAGILLLQVGTGVLAAYGFAVGRFKGRNALFYVVLGALMIPLQVTFIPIYIMCANWNLCDTFLGLILPEAVSAVDTRKELAEAVGLGERTMGKVIQIDENAPDAIKEALDKKELSINKGYDLTRQLQDVPEDQREQAAAELLEYEKAKKDLKQQNAEIDRRGKVANLFCKAYEKASLLTATEENVRCWTEGTRMTLEELQDTVKESREIAQVFMSIADIIEQTILPSDWRNTDPTDDTPGEVVA